MQQKSSKKSTNGQETLIVKQPNLPNENQDDCKLSLKNSVSLSGICNQYKYSKKSNKITKSSSYCSIDNQIKSV